MLADLVLADLPFEVLITLKHAINDEILLRKKQQYLTRQLRHFQRTSAKPPSNTLPFDEAITALIDLNTHGLFSLPSSALRQHFQDRIRYLPCLLAQDWTTVFPNRSNDMTEFYVYAHLDPRDAPIKLYALQLALKGVPFYIGKGTGNRAWDLKRNQGHGKKIKQIRDAGFPDTSMVQIIADSLGERDALILEAKLIYLFGSIYDQTIHKGCLFNLADSARPSFTKPMQKLPKRRLYGQRLARHLLREDIERHLPQAQIISTQEYSSHSSCVLACFP